MIVVYGQFGIEEDPHINTTIAFSHHFWVGGPPEVGVLLAETNILEGLASSTSGPSSSCTFSTKP